MIYGTNRKQEIADFIIATWSDLYTNFVIEDNGREMTIYMSKGKAKSKLKLNEFNLMPSIAIEAIYNQLNYN